MSYCFEKAISEETASIFALYEKRVKWMDECGIRQWNTTDYLNVYPIDYYEQEIKSGNLFVVKSENRIIRAVVLLQSDDRWPDKADSPAYYIHNLVTDYDLIDNLPIFNEEKIRDAHNVESCREFLLFVRIDLSDLNFAVIFFREPFHCDLQV